MATKETLLAGILKLLHRTEQREIRARYAYEIQNYESKLMQLSLVEKGSAYE